MSSLWIEPFGGVAGDMLLAALLDLDDPRFGLGDLRALAEELCPGEARLELERVRRGGLAGRLLTVTTPESATLPHRHLADLLERLERSPLTAAARSRAGAALRAIARAEAAVHGTTPDEVHFHEIGAVDTLVDVGGFALALERLGVREVFASPPLVGSGTVRCAHGEMPVPVPAVVELLRGRPVLGGGGGERTTPTGAALLATATERFGPPPSFAAEAVGYGAGRRDPDEGPPNLLRVQLGEARAGTDGARAEAWLLEVNLDDMSPEELGHAVGALRSAGALEVWTTAAQMKKDRPAAILSALARAGERAALERVTFEWTTTLGVRWTRLERTECGRRQVSVDVGGEPVRVTVRERPAALAGAPPGERDLFPEHDDVARAAEASGRSLREVRRAAVAAALASLA